jgi:hypothetical protein
MLNNFYTDRLSPPVLINLEVMPAREEQKSTVIDTKQDEIMLYKNCDFGIPPRRTKYLYHHYLFMNNRLPSLLRKI